MKSLHYLRHALALVAMTVFLTDCRKPEEVAAVKNCQLTGRTEVSTHSTNPFTLEEKYEYDSEERLIKYSVNTKSSSSAYTSATTYTYDLDGFLTRQRNESESDGLKSTTETGYTYANGRLIRAGRSNSLFGGSVTIYEYDSQGNLTKIANASGSTTYNDQTIKNGKIVATAALGSLAHTLEDGLITRAGSATSYSVYQYDQKRRPIRIESWTNITMVGYYTIEYREGNLPENAKGVPFKGHPVVLSIYGELGLNTKMTFYVLSNNTFQKSSEITYIHQLNSRDFPVETSVTYTAFNLATGQMTETKSKKTYSYENCN